MSVRKFSPHKKNVVFNLNVECTHKKIVLNTFCQQIFFFEKLKRREKLEKFIIGR